MRVKWTGDNFQLSMTHRLHKFSLLHNCFLLLSMINYFPVFSFHIKLPQSHVWSILCIITNHFNAHRTLDICTCFISSCRFGFMLFWHLILHLIFHLSYSVVLMYCNNRLKDSSPVAQSTWPPELPSILTPCSLPYSKYCQLPHPVHLMVAI